ncbi:hypothetical protein GIB67_013152 [Kingdonia uniflora]|uniref:Uncharacterized protein n=1 Tax=Kingdonia uniflora TaxID=39325 RepID=A0A7J7LCN9_9MAGN|nr:hypothetical protein GIB67_013152 [Kingdonia uniflora]
MEVKLSFCGRIPKSSANYAQINYSDELLNHNAFKAPSGRVIFSTSYSRRINRG